MCAAYGSGKKCFLVGALLWLILCLFARLAKNKIENLTLNLACLVGFYTHTHTYKQPKTKTKSKAVGPVACLRAFDVMGCNNNNNNKTTTGQKFITLLRATFATASQSWTFFFSLCAWNLLADSQIHRRGRCAFNMIIIIIIIISSIIMIVVWGLCFWFSVWFGFGFQFFPRNFGFCFKWAVKEVVAD